ncbi:MAG TPA: methyltransferase domain-containing protein [Desulfitobacteriaceae bacterium]|nr:methyltransferase domain-containing protein [Desulfitobacteriaceae bacterium]
MKTFEEKSREWYNRIADNYDNTFDGRFTEKFKKLLLEEIKIKPGESILDVACGNGRLLKMLASKYAIKGYGVDLAEKMIENARKNCPDMVFEVNSCEHTSFKNQMFDVITVCVAYHHFPDVKAFAREANRLLKPEGLLYIAEGHLPFIIREIFNLFVPLSKGGNVKVYSPREIKDNFEAYGFKQVGYTKKGFIQIIEMCKLSESSR